MDVERVARVIASPTSAAVDDLLRDSKAVFWVDWREDDDAIVEYCESILGTGSLAAEVMSAENDAGFEMFLSYKDKRSKVPLVVGREDRHITLVAMNGILAPDYEARLCVDSLGGDTLAFLPLPTSAWRQLEATYGAAVEKRFYRLKATPNVFTEKLPS